MRDWRVMSVGGRRPDAGSYGWHLGHLAVKPFCAAAQS